MRDYVDLGPTPAYEQASDSPRQPDLNKAECRIFRKQLERQFPIPAGTDAQYVIHGNPHDFGTYYEVGVSYDDSDRVAADFAWDMQDKYPEHWDDQAKAELAAWKASHEAVPA